MVAAGGKKSTTSLSLFIEAFGFGSGRRALYYGDPDLAEVTWIGKWYAPEVQMYEIRVPERREEDACATGKVSLLEGVGSKA